MLGYIHRFRIFKILWDKSNFETLDTVILVYGTIRWLEISIFITSSHVIQDDTQKRELLWKPNKNWSNPAKKIYWQKLNHYYLPFKIWSMITKMARLSVAQGPCSAVLPTVHSCHYVFQKFPFFVSPCIRMDLQEVGFGYMDWIW